MTEQSKFVADAKAGIADMGAQIDKLEASAASATGDAKAAYDKQIVALKAQQKDAEAHLKKAEAAGESDWEDAMNSAKSSWDSLKNSVSKAAASIG